MKPIYANRRAVLGAITAACAATLFVVSSSGCGGGKKKEATADTGTQSGSLTTVQITPAPGTAYVSRSTTFRLAWTSSNPPPPSFTAALVRYKESGGSSSTDTQASTLTRQGDSFTWDLKRADNFDLEAPGVYYVELNSGPEQVRATYIVATDRSVPIASPAPASRAVQAEPSTTNGEGDALVHEVSVGR